MDWLSQLFNSLLPFLNSIPAVRAILGFMIAFFLPGFAWTFIFFKELKPIERVALSFGISIAVVTLSIVALNVLFGMKITGLNSLLVIITISAIPALIFLIKKFVANRPGNPPDD